MDSLKKRKLDDNGVVMGDPAAFSPVMLSIDDARKILEPLTHDQLLEIVQQAMLRHPDVLDAARSIADRDITQRKLFVRGLGWETTTEKLRAIFSPYGQLDEAVVVLDKTTGKSKGYGFVTFKHVDGAILALKEPSKKIDGRMTVAQLATAGISGGAGPGSGSGAGGVSNPVDVSLRKIYVSNVPYDMSSERLLQHFTMYGQIEEGPLGFDKATGKSKGFALFVYKTAEAARASLLDPIKNIDGHQLNCKLAIDGKRGKPTPGAGVVGVPGGGHGNGDGIGVVPSQYGGHGGIGGNHSGFSGSSGAAAGAGMGGPGFPGIGNQAAGSNSGVSGGFGSGIGGPYAGGSHFGGVMGTAYGGFGAAALGPGAGLGAALGGGVGSGMNVAGRGSSLYGLPTISGGIGSGEHAQGGHYSLSSGGYQGQHNQPAGSMSAPRVLPGGAFHGMPPYY